MLALHLALHTHTKGQRRTGDGRVLVLRKRCSFWLLFISIYKQKECLTTPSYSNAMNIRYELHFPRSDHAMEDANNQEKNIPADLLMQDRFSRENKQTEKITCMHVGLMLTHLPLILTCWFNLRNSKASSEILEPQSPKWLCQYVGELLFSPDVTYFDLPCIDAIPDEMIPCIDMFAPVMEHRVAAE